MNHIIASNDDIEKYSCDEAHTAFMLYEYWTKNLEEAETKLVNSIELPLTEVLAKMEYNGVAINSDYLKENLTLPNLDDISKKIFIETTQLMDKNLKRSYEVLDLPITATVEEVELRKNALIKIEKSNENLKQVQVIDQSATRIIENIKKKWHP